MAEVTRTNTETVAKVTSSQRKITVTGLKALTIAESRELRALLKAEEKKAEKQSERGWVVSSDWARPYTFIGSGF